MNTILNNSSLTATINHKGAELISLRDHSGREYIWNGNPQFWAKHSPVLFPIVGVLKNNHYNIDGEIYNLTRHGFAREMTFDLIESSAYTCTFSLQYTDETIDVFPFKFKLNIKYILSRNEIQVVYCVINNGKSQMPFSIGAHPAFALSQNFEDYAIEFEKDEELTYHILDNDLISDKTEIIEMHHRLVPLRYSLFKNDALIFKKIQSKSITILHKSERVAKIGFADFPNLGIWTKPNAPFICIEPWHGYTDTLMATGNLFEKEGIQILEPAENFTVKFTIEIF